MSRMTRLEHCDRFKPRRWPAVQERVEGDMSRMTRLEHCDRFKPRTTVKKHLAQLLARLRPKAVPKSKRTEPLHQFRWAGGTVRANTRGEARHQIKETLGVKRLPPHFHIEQVK